MSPVNNPAQNLRDLLNTLLPPTNTYQTMVKKDLQDKKIDMLDEAIAHESFYFVFNLVTGEIDQVNGVEKWLGYSNNEFNLHRYLAIIHPGQAVLHNMIAQSMYKTLCKGAFKLQFSKQRYISQIGLRHYNGNYIGFKKTTSIFQYDQENRLLAQLNEFTMIHNYESEPLKPRITEIDGLQKDSFEQLVFQLAIKFFMEKKYFSETEFKILKTYVEKETISSKQMAELLGLAIQTIDTFNKRILEKSRKTFTHPFTNAKQVALYLKNEKIL